MTDHFAVLRLPRRPWLDPDQIKEQYQQLTRASHPDRSRGDDRNDSAFAAITEAYRVLSSPRLRLQHLLELEGNTDSTIEAAQVATDLSDIFLSAATLAREIDALLQKRDQATSTLGKSLLQSELGTVRGRAEALLQQLEGLYAGAMDELQQIDQTWTSDNPTSLGGSRQLAQRFAFLERWIDQLREKQFQLSN